MSSSALGGITSGTVSWAAAPATLATSAAAASPELNRHRRERIMALASLVRAEIQAPIRRQDNNSVGPKVAQNFVVENAETAVPAMILAGGLSRRMGGGDKCLLPLGDRPLLAHVIERLRPQAGPFALNANGDA